MAETSGAVAYTHIAALHLCTYVLVSVIIESALEYCYIRTSACATSLDNGSSKKAGP